MSSTTFTLLLVSNTALLLSIGACIVAVLSWLRYRSTSSARLSARLSEIESTLEALSAALKNVRAARNMAAHRARQSSSEFSEGQPSTVIDPKLEERREGDRLLAARSLGRI